MIVFMMMKTMDHQQRARCYSSQGMAQDHQGHLPISCAPGDDKEDYDFNELFNSRYNFYDQTKFMLLHQANVTASGISVIVMEMICF